MLNVANEFYFSLISGLCSFNGIAIVTYFFIFDSDLTTSLFRMDEGTQKVLFVEAELCDVFKI